MVLYMVTHNTRDYRIAFTFTSLVYIKKAGINILQQEGWD